MTSSVFFFFSEWEVERPNCRAGQPEDRHGDDVIDDQLREGSCGGLHSSFHGDGYRHRGGQAYRYHLSYCLFR